MRWHHPERGLISPAQFIPIAEESDLISSLGEWALVTACRQLFEWDASGHPAPRVGVNVSARQFHSPGFADLVARSLRERRISPSRLELELTEGVLIDDREEAVLMDPPLSTVRVHKEEIGETCMKMLLERLHHPQMAFSQRVLPTELIIRGSVRQL